MLLHLGRGSSPIAISSVLNSVLWYDAPEAKADDTSPVLYADFANDRYAVNGASVSFSDLFTFTRSTIGTYFGSDGLLKTAAINERRINHDPSTGKKLGLLKEESRTNQLLRSNQFDTSWTTSVVSVSPAGTISPDGSVNAWTLSDGVSAGFHTLTQSVTVTSGTTYTFSVYAKKGTHSFVQIVPSTTTFGVNVWGNFDIENVEIGTVGSSGTYKIQNVGNGWVRIMVTAPATASTTNNGFNIAFANSLSMYRASGYSGANNTFYIYGAQMEVGGFASSYIPTTTTSVTRAVDNISNGSANVVPFSSWYNVSAGTFYVDAEQFYLGTFNYPRFLAANNGASTHEWALSVQDGSSDQYGFSITTAGSTQASLHSGQYIADLTIRMAMAAASNDSRGAYGGILTASDNTVVMPTVDRLAIGDNYNSTRLMFGHIKEIRYYDFRVTNSEMERITLYAPVPEFVSTTNLPDGLGGDVGEGFTCTGLAYDATDDTFWFGNDGRNNLADTSYQSSIVHTSKNGATKLGEIDLVALYPAIKSVQGVAIDTSDNTIWFSSTDENLVRHITKAGAHIGSFAVTAPNGLAYDAVHDELLVLTNASNLVRYSKSGTAGTSISMSLVSPDMLWLSADANELWMSYGFSISTGCYMMGCRFSDGFKTGQYLVAEATAIEGIHYDGTNLYIANDAYMHVVPNNKNALQVYTFDASSAFPG